MRRIIHTLGHTLAPALLVLAVGCKAYKLEPPAGFAEAYSYDESTHLKANNNVGLKIQRFPNVKGGTLTFWSRDMVEKLGKRGYTLVGQSPAESKNGVVGTRFDFTYTPVGEAEPPRFYTVVLFVTDKHKVVVQLAGLETYKPQYSSEVDKILGELKIRGCKVATKACKGPQPEKLSTPAPVVQAAAPEGEGETTEGDAEKPAGEAEKTAGEAEKADAAAPAKKSDEKAKKADEKAKKSG